MNTEETRKSSKESPPTSFSSLPYDVALNILARISRIHRPTLSIVSKSFRSLVASRELDVTRTLMGKTENYTYICLKFRKDLRPGWFILATTPKQQKLIRIPWFSNEHPILGTRHPESPTVVSVGSLIYLIGGFVYGKKSRRVFLLDCRSHQWRTLPKMRIHQGRSAAGLIDGKIYVLGGCNFGENWGEICDPKTQTWELLSPTTLTPHISVQKSLEEDRPGRFKWTKLYFYFVAEEKILCTSLRFTGSSLNWCDAEEDTEWREVKRLNGLPDTPDFMSAACWDINPSPTSEV